MKKMNKKGFTIVELVIVIAVIAILAAVMIPTFSGIVDKANKSALEQKVAAAYKEAMAEELADDGLYNDSAKNTDTNADGTKDALVINGITFEFTDDKGNATATFTGNDDYNTATFTNGKITLSKT